MGQGARSDYFWPFPIKTQENIENSLHNPLKPPMLIENFVACIFRHGARNWRRRLRNMQNSACSSTACSSGTVPPTHLLDKTFTTQTVSSLYSATKTCKTEYYRSDFICNYRNCICTDGEIRNVTFCSTEKLERIVQTIKSYRRAFLGRRKHSVVLCLNTEFRS